jgi:hypothetical protein
MQNELEKLVKLDGTGKILISTKGLCQVLGVSRMMISKYGKDGMPKRSVGWWCLEEVLAWLNTVSTRQPDGKTQVTDKARKLKADADYKELKAEREEIVLEALKGQYIKKDEIVREWTERVLNLKTSLLSLPKLIAREFLDQEIGSLVEKKVQEYVIEYLNEYARQGKYTPKRREK